MSSPSPNVFYNGVGAVTADNFNTFAQTVYNLAQLRTLTAKNNSAVLLLGYVTPNDGGQAFYTYTSTGTYVDNGTTVIVPSGTLSGAWLQLVNLASNLSTVASYSTRTTFAATSVPTAVTSVFVGGYSSPRDGGGAEYFKLPSAPTTVYSAGQLQTLDGAWWQIATPTPDARALGLSASASDNAAALIAASAFCVAATATLVIADGTYATLSNLTVNCPLSFVSGGILAPATGTTIQIDSELTAPPFQIFSGAGAITLPLQNAVVYAEWWGAAANNSTPSRAAIQSAVNSLTSGGIVQLLFGYYRLDGVGITITTTGTSLQGYGKYDTKLYPTVDSGQVVISITSTGSNLRNFQMNGSLIGTNNGMTAVGNFTGTVGLCLWEGLYIYEFNVGIRVLNANALEIASSRIEACNNGLYLGGGTYGVQFVGDCTFREIVIPSAWNGSSANGLGVIIDTGVNAFYSSRIEVVGGYVGVTIQDTVNNSGAGLWHPQNIWFWDSNIDGAHAAQVNIVAGKYLQFDTTAISGCTNGPGAELANAYTNAIEGVIFNNCQIADNYYNGILWSSGRNLIIQDCQIYTNGFASSNTYAGVQVQAAAQGLFQMTGGFSGMNNSNNTGFGNVYNGIQNYGVSLASGALTSVTGSTGRVFIDAVMMGGNGTGGLNDGSAPSSSYKTIGTIQQTV